MFLKSADFLLIFNYTIINIHIYIYILVAIFCKERRKIQYYYNNI
jgi:hypothetical protein